MFVFFFRVFSLSVVQLVRRRRGWPVYGAKKVREPWKRGPARVDC